MAEPRRLRATSEVRAWRLALALVGAVTAVRVALLFATPLELYPDEAQYWLWAQAPAWGYASKPPMIAWLIWLTTRAGDGEAWVRLSAPLLHGATALVLFRAARRLFGPAEGLLSAALWMVTPAVLLSSTFIATDAALILCLSLALWAYACLLQARTRPERLAAAVALGAALGAGALAKQAAIYFLLGLLIEAVTRRPAREAWRGWAWLAALAVGLLVLSPNLLWQAQHHFATLTHTATVNAGMGGAHHLRPMGPVMFLLAQLGVLGPVPLIIVLGGAVVGLRTGSLRGRDRALLAFALPPLVLMTLFAAFGEVEANWGASGYGAAVVFVSGWLVRRNARGWGVAALATGGAAAVLFAVLIADPSLADRTGQNASLKRLRGWRETAAFSASVLRRTAPVTAVLVEDRSLFNELAYYGRGWLRAPDAPPLRMRPPQGRALNQAELLSPLRPDEGGRTLVLEMKTPGTPRLPAEFFDLRPVGARQVRLDTRHSRDLQAWLGLGYRGPTPPAALPVGPESSARPS